MKINSGILIIFLLVLLLTVWLSYYLTMHFSLSFELFFMISIHTLLLVAFLNMCVLLSGKEYLKAIGWLKILTILGVGFFSMYLYLTHNDYYRTRKGLESTVQNCINEVGGAILSYVDKQGKYPCKESWYDEIVNDNESVKKYFYYLGGMEKKHPDMAFNENLSNLTPTELSQNTILLIEATGPWNFTGSKELLDADREKDEYYPDRDKFIFIYFVNSTLAKYRICDGAIALYNPDEKSFSRWQTKGETKYSPLKW